MIPRSLTLGLLASFLLSILLLATPVTALNNQYSEFSLSRSINTFSTLNYEVKEKNSLSNPIQDPNFNVMRNSDMNKTGAVVLVGGILLIAIIAPIATWWYFSR